jgi:hypothetical protein
MVIEIHDKDDNEVEVRDIGSELPIVISSKEASGCFEKWFEYFSSQSAASNSFQTDLNRMTEIGKGKEERKSQAKITDLFDFNKI